MKRKILLFTLFIIGFVLNLAVVHGQTVNIPDPNFKAALVSNPTINTNGDLEIQPSEAQVFSGWINVASEGIAAFTALNCSNNPLGTLDVSANVALTTLRCSDNQLTTLDLSHNTSLKYLYVNDNLQLTALDLSNNTAL